MNRIFRTVWVTILHILSKWFLKKVNFLGFLHLNNSSIRCELKLSNTFVNKYFRNIFSQGCHSSEPNEKGYLIYYYRITRELTRFFLYTDSTRCDLFKHVIMPAMLTIASCYLISVKNFFCALYFVSVISRCSTPDIQEAKRGSAQVEESVKTRWDKIL